MRSNKIRGFSFVELIIASSIIILLAVIGNGYLSTYTENSQNQKIISDLKMLSNSLLAYSEDKGELPLAGGNNNFFKIDTSYAHDWESSDTYGAHGFITKDVMPASYINYVPIDPRTNQYFAYGKTKTNQYEISGIVKKSGENISVVYGNYTAEIGPYNLVREYNGPNFVYNKSKKHFPYNPDERIITAKINDYYGNGSVTINGSINNPDEILSYTLLPGDTIEVGAGTYAEIFFSDGTVSTLGEQVNSSSVKLSKMSYIGDTNLFTKIALVLSSGTIWNKATNLADKSEFEVYTTDSSAAVRGTVFGVRKQATNTNVTVRFGKVLVKNLNASSTTILEDNILNNNVSFGSTSEIIEVKKGEIEKGKDINSSSLTLLDNKSALDKVSVDIINDFGDISNSIGPEIEYYEKSNSSLSIKLRLNEIFIHKAEYLKLVTSSDDIYKYSNNTWPKILELDGNTYFETTGGATQKLKELIAGKDNIMMYFCREKSDNSELCSKGTYIDLKNINYVDTDLKIIDRNLNCRENQVSFGDDIGCVDNALYSSGYSLVAYAPYDTNGDLNMYDSTGKKLEIFTNKIASGYKKNDTDSSTENDSTTLPSSCINNIITTDVIKSFCELENGEKGIFMDNIGNDDYIKYNIGALDLGDNYALEIKLMENSIATKSYLFDFLEDDLSEIHIDVDNKLKLFNISATKFLNQSLREEGKLFNEIIIVDNNKINGYEINKGRILSVGSLQFTNSMYFGQQDKVIDYVKIYKK